MKPLRSGRSGILVLMAIALLVSCSDLLPGKADEEALAGTRAVAEEAYIWAYPMLMNYGTLYETVIDENNPHYRAPFNHIQWDDQLPDPTVKSEVIPNIDTLFSTFALDLRSEPQVLSAPAMSDRYCVFQCIDLFAHNSGYFGSRATGSEAGHFLIAGPGWQGEAPEGIDHVFHPESDVALVLARLQVFGDDDLQRAVALQKQVTLQPLSAFLGEAPPEDPGAIHWPPWNEVKAGSPDFVEYVNFLLTFCEPLHPSDAQLMRRFAAIGISPGQPYDPAVLDLDARNAVAEGIASAREKIAERAMTAQTLINGWATLDAFGDREFAPGDPLLRAAGAWAWLHGEDRDEVLCYQARLDGHGDPLDGGKHEYVFTLETDNPPPARFFWSLTLYGQAEDGRGDFLLENPIGRYKIDPRTSGLLRDEMGDIVLYIQHEKPMGNRAKNWLPAPKAPFTLYFRLYGPEEAALDGTWAPTPVIKTVF